MPAQEHLSPEQFPEQLDLFDDATKKDLADRAAHDVMTWFRRGIDPETGAHVEYFPGWSAKNGYPYPGDKHAQ